MNQKEYIIKILDKLSAYRPIAKGLKVLLNQDKLDDEQVKGLLVIFEHSIKEVSDKTQKEKLQTSINAIKKMQLLESGQSKQDQKDIQDLDKNLENI